MPVPKSLKSKKTHTTTKGIKEEQVDSLVEELLGGKKKLTKAQQKRKAELEEYLMQKLEHFNEESDQTESSESGTEDSESDSDTETSSSGDSSDCSCEYCDGSSDDGEDSHSQMDSDDSTDDDNSYSSSEEDTQSGTDSEDGEDNGKHSDEFSGEYTLNSYSDSE